LFLKKAIEIGADFVATGHYCRKEEVIINGNKVQRLLEGKDPKKDQSYFLCQVNQFQLSKTLFPIGDMQKSEVRKLAKEIGLNTAEKKDSQGLCFIGKVKLPTFLQQFLKPKTGKVVEIDSKNLMYHKENITNKFKSFEYSSSMGKIVGDNNGAHYYTIGQRKGLNIGGFPLPLFIIGTDVKKNIIYVGQGEDHPGLYRNGLTVNKENIHWIREDLKIDLDTPTVYNSRIRYRQKLTPCTITSSEFGLKVKFGETQRGITPGQFISWYKNDELIGSGIIN
jgi:tRNA-specific 2-thiouridylase